MLKPLTVTLGSRIKAFREALGWTQGDLAGRVGVHVMTLSRWELDKNQPKGEEIVGLAKSLGVSADEILGLSASHDPASTSTSSTTAGIGADLAATIAQAVAQAVAPLVQAQVRSETRLGRIEGILDHQRDILERQGETQEKILDELRQEGCCGHDDQRGAA